MSRPSNGQKWHAGAEALADETRRGKSAWLDFATFPWSSKWKTSGHCPFALRRCRHCRPVVDPTKPEHLIQTAYQRGAPVHQDRVDLSN
jgi:hypothetical protein